MYHNTKNSLFFYYLKENYNKIEDHSNTGEAHINRKISDVLNEISKHIVTAEMNKFIVSDRNKYIVGTVGLQLVME